MSKAAGQIEHGNINTDLRCTPNGRCHLSSNFSSSAGFNREDFETEMLLLNFRKCSDDRLFRKRELEVLIIEICFGQFWNSSKLGLLNWNLEKTVNRPTVELRQNGCANAHEEQLAKCLGGSRFASLPITERPADFLTNNYLSASRCEIVQLPLALTPFRHPAERSSNNKIIKINCCDTHLLQQ